MRELRQNRGWTQEETAARVGGSRSQVSRDERLGWLNTRRLVRYSLAFGVELALLTEVLDEEEA